MNYKIIVDSGHGGEDPGAVSGNLKEKDFNLRAANYMYNRFKELGIPVTSTKTTDKTLTREERLNIMNNTYGRTPNVIILSNHINAGGGEGAEVVYPLRSNDRLAKSILEEIGNAGQITRKYYQRRLPEDPSKDYYYIMRETPDTTALLIEYGFIDNPNDVKKLNANLLTYAEAVVKAVANYIGVPYVSPGGVTENTYTVQRGDSLYSIAQKFNTSVDRLKQLNNLTNNALQIGQTLIISESAGTTPTTENYIVYTVKSGDSLWKIANEYETTVSDIVDLNNLENNNLQVGQQLKIPTNTVTVPQSDFYIVQSGDSLWKIANQLGVSVNDIIEANNLASTVLQVGQQLKIPGSTGTTPTPPVTPPSTTSYTVQRGDSLWSIANRFNTTVAQLRALNNLTTDALQIGQQLKIASSPATNYTEYTVRSGDSLWSIANRFNTTVSQIRSINNLASDVLQIGQILRIPQ